MKKILLIEDDKSIADSLSYYLKSEGFLVDSSYELETGDNLLKENNYHIILLDINLPDGNGYDYLNKIKDRQRTPVIFLTALDEEINIVRGLDLGAEDYITKPFRAKELVARINKVLRSKTKENIINIKDIVINTDTAKIYKDKKEIFLSATEYKLLLILAQNKNKVLSREKLLQILWGTDMDFVNDNTLTVYIKRLREKLETNIIETIRGLGYIIKGENHE